MERGVAQHIGDRRRAPRELVFGFESHELIQSARRPSTAAAFSLCRRVGGDARSLSPMRARRVRAPLVDPPRGHRLRAPADVAPTFLEPDVLALDGAWSFALRDRPEHVTDDDLAGPTDGLGRRSRCRAAGRCRASTARSTRTCRCRSPARRPRVPDANPTGVYRRTVTVPAGVGRAAHRAARRRRRVGALRARRRRAGRHGQGLAPARTSSTSPASSSPASTVRARAHRGALVGRHLPRGPGPLVPRRACTAACSSTPRRRCTSPTSTPPPTSTRRPATAACDVRRRPSAPRAPAPKGWTARVALGGAARRAPRCTSSTRRLARQLPACSRAARRDARRSTFPDVAPWTAETPNLHELTVTLLDADGTEVDAVVAARSASAASRSSATSCS